MNLFITKSKEQALRLFAFLLACLFPKRCYSCGLEGAWLCKSCRSKLPAASSLACPACQKPSLNGERCQTCSKDGLDQILAAFNYNDSAVSKAIKDFKYRFAYSVGNELAELLSDYYSNFNFSNVLVVPIPLHWRRQAWRGFNQAEILAKQLSRDYDAPLVYALRRHVLGQPQAQLGFQERQKNIKNMFSCVEPSLVFGKTIILIDDVATTCATLNESARVLKAAGAQKVIGLVVAHG